MIIIAFIIGILSAGTPQAFLNYKNAKYNGVQPSISFFPQSGGNFISQIYNGLFVQRYDTYIGQNNFKEQEEPYMTSPDPVGKKLFELEGNNMSFKGFIKIIIKYPFEYAGVCIRHLINMAFPCWPNQYVTKLNNNKLPYAILSLLIIYLFILSCIFRCIKNKLPYILLSPLILVCLACLPDGREMRYIVGLFFIMVGTLSFNINYKMLIGSIKKNWISVLVLFFSFAAIMISQWTYALMTQETGIPIFMLGQ